MPRRPKPISRWLTAATWPFGVAVTSWDYLWRSTPMHRRETVGGEVPEDEPMLAHPPQISEVELQPQEDGHGPLFHRRYRTRIRACRLSASELMAAVMGDPNHPAPAFARFQKLAGPSDRMADGDEYVVRMPAPWDGPVQVIDVGEDHFRLATLAGHLEAGQIEFRSAPVQSGQIEFEIESWARSGSRLSHLMYAKLRMAKEVQAHMWISFLEGVVALSGGKMTGGIVIETERYEGPDGGEAGDGVSPRAASDEALLGPRRVRRLLGELAHRDVNFDLAELQDADSSGPAGSSDAAGSSGEAGVGDGWSVTDLCQPLAPEPPGMPEEDGSFQIARRLMWGYEFADPSVVRAYYDPSVPLEGRNMVLKLQALGLVHLYVGVRVAEVFERTCEIEGRDVHLWGWSYRTLEGHVEEGQMDWEVWKWLDTGEVQFRVHSLSRTAPIGNPFVRLGFQLLKGHERQVFLDSTKRRMAALTQLAVELKQRGVQGEQRGEPLRQAAAELTARRLSAQEAAPDQLARTVAGDRARSLRDR